MAEDNGADAVIGSREQAMALLKNRPTELKQKRVAISSATFIVQELTAREHSAFEKSLLVGKGRDQHVEMLDAKAKLVARSVVDEAGVRIFADADVGFLGTLPTGDIERLYAAAQELSGISDEDVEEMAGNSEGDPSGAS